MAEKPPNRMCAHNSATLWHIKTKLGIWTWNYILIKENGIIYCNKQHCVSVFKAVNKLIHMPANNMGGPKADLQQFYLQTKVCTDDLCINSHKCY